MQRPQQGQQQERRERNRFNKQRNNSAHAAHCFEHLFAVITVPLRREIPSSRTAFHEGSKHTMTSQFCFSF